MKLFWLVVGFSRIYIILWISTKEDEEEDAKKVPQGVDIMCMHLFRLIPYLHPVCVCVWCRCGVKIIFSRLQRKHVFGEEEGIKKEGYVCVCV